MSLDGEPGSLPPEELEEVVQEVREQQAPVLVDGNVIVIDGEHFKIEDPAVVRAVVKRKANQPLEKTTVVLVGHGEDTFEAPGDQFVELCKMAPLHSEMHKLEGQAETSQDIVPGVINAYREKADDLPDDWHTQRAA